MTGGEPPRLDAVRREEIEAVFEEALELPLDRRDAWLAARCGADVTLRQEVEALLAAHGREDALLDGSPAPFAAFASALIPDPARDRMIGPYRVLRELGRGGMGVVYLAERADGQFRRRVAVKLLLASPDAEQLRRRFVAERQILASLSHPNIAQLLDGGITADHLPYLVIEYVDGVPITWYCEREGLDLAARLELFQSVCAAVHHAHRNLVLHRDLKPGNILVGTDGQPKLLDFGIAKILNPDLAMVDAPVTHTAGRPMTLAYASPEQVRGDPLSTASDVYALGLVLYELLTNSRAVDLADLGPREALNRISEGDIDRPSARAPHLARRLRGDLDAIVMMALRKEAQHRYGSADRLAADIGRYLEGLPVQAHRGSAWYRARKVFRRHRTAASALALFVVTLAGGASVAVWQARIAIAERTRAADALVRTEAALRQSEAVTGFLIALFEPSDPSEGRRDVMSTAELLQRGMRRAERLVDEPVVQAQMYDALGQVYLSLGEYGTARDLTERGLVLREAHLPAEDPLIPTSMAHQAAILSRSGRYPEADSLAEAALARRRAILGNDHADVAASLRLASGIAVYRNDLARALAHIEEAVAIDRALPASEVGIHLADDLITLGSVQWRLGDQAGTVAAQREAEAVARQRFPYPSTAHAMALGRLAETLAWLPGGAAEAELMARDAFAETLAAEGPQHPQTLAAELGVAWVLTRQGRMAEAAELTRAALEVQRQIYGPTDPTIAGTLGLLATTTAGTGRQREAEALQDEAVAIYRDRLGENHSAYAGSIGGLADLLILRGALDSAETLHRRAVAIRERVFGPGTHLLAITALGLARVEAARGDYQAADSIYRASLAIVSAHTGARHPDVRAIHRALADVNERWGRPAEAEVQRALAQ